MSAIPVAVAPAIEKYEILEEIGHGGMATVYRARDERLGRDVAIKVIHKHLQANREVAARFVSEARAAAQLRHPNIVEVFDVSGEESKERYIVAELIRGTTLRKILEDHGVLPAEIGASLALELCDALQHAHESGIIHRDIKPENVLVELPADRLAASTRESENGASEGGPGSGGKRRDPDASGATKKVDADDLEDASDDLERTSEPRVSSRRSGKARGVVIKITDFGIAKLLDAQGVTSTGQVLGSPAHMAPEQIEGGDVDGRTDVFALGVLLYECVVGHLPFEGKNPAQVLRRVLEGQYCSAELEQASVGGAWSRILDGALAKDMEDRIESPGELSELMRAELEALGITDPAAELRAFFEDPEAYADVLTERLVPRLVERGERARKKKNIPDAACQFNRALALSPNDPAILKRVTNLTSRANRRAMLKRVGAVVGVSVLLGMAAFGIARLVSEEATIGAELPRPAPTKPIKADDPAPNTIKAVSEKEPAPTPSSTSKPDLAMRPRFKAAIRVGALSKGPRPVQFAIRPMSATLLVDGVQVDHDAAQNLKPGPHAVVVRHVDCCEPITTSVTVEVANKEEPDKLQQISLALQPKPAKVMLVGGPPGATAQCGQFGTIGASWTTIDIKPSYDKTMTCSVVGADNKSHTVSVTLKAGKAARVLWPSH